MIVYVCLLTTQYRYLMPYCNWKRLQNFGAALIDADKCVEIDNTWTKGVIRKGEALHALKRYSEARDTYDIGMTAFTGVIFYKETEVGRL